MLNCLLGYFLFQCSSQSAVFEWLNEELLSVCSLPPSLLCGEKTRSPAACCRYFWGMWSWERLSPTNASPRWRETPERCERWEGPWGRTRWVWLTLIDRFLSSCFVLVCGYFQKTFSFIVNFLAYIYVFFSISTSHDISNNLISNLLIALVEGKEKVDL